MHQIPNVFLSGKVTNQDWRTSVLSDTCSHKFEPINMGGWIYCGPFYNACRHGCVRQMQNLHGQSLGGECCFGPQKYQHEIKQKCFEGVSDCDVFVVYLNAPACYGTMVEVGWAEALRKQIVVLVDSSISQELRSDFWFCTTGHPVIEVAHPSDLPWILDDIAVNYSLIYMENTHV